MKRQAIRHEGDTAENRFLELVKGSMKSDNSKRGDALVPYKGSMRYVEIKECHSDTINQVRAVKYIPLIIYTGDGSAPWIVIPPQEVVRLVATKSRGQHTEVPFESANLSKKRLPIGLHASDANLDQSVRTAIEKGEKFTEVEEVMNLLIKKLQILNRLTKRKVKQAARLTPPQ